MTGLGRKWLWPTGIKRQILSTRVRDGSKTEVSGLARHVRYTLRIRHRQPVQHVRLVPTGDLVPFLHCSAIGD